MRLVCIPELFHQHHEEGGIDCDSTKSRYAIPTYPRFLFDDIPDILNGTGKPSTTSFPQWKTIEQGAATTVVAAFDPRIEDQSGGYLSDGNLANKDIAQNCLDPMTGFSLWLATEEVLGEKLSF
ncbi:hypothetical protein C8F01DRAFT_330441 [Mycena amicta]|nr:hypothetical protein C8F01DRAFT_330441 [Mycena amicta]